MIAADVMALNEWQMFTVTADSSGNARMFKNGQLVQTGTINLTNTSRVNCYIGRSNWSADDYYQGLLDDIRIYNYGLTNPEVATLYNGL